MPAINLTEGIVNQILWDEHDSTRFEKFCVELLSAHDGVSYVPTSSSWDLGRDGRAFSSTDENIPYLCGSLRDDVSNKVTEDIKRLKETTKVLALQFCSSQKMSETACASAKENIQKILTDCKTVQCNGSLQISTIVLRDDKYGRIFYKFYPGEIAAYRIFLNTPSDVDEQRNMTGMRLALTTQLNNDGDKLREELVCNIVLTILSSQKAVNQAILAKTVTDFLRLGSVVSMTYLQGSIDLLLSKKLIEIKDNKYTITKKGESQYCKSIEAGKRTLISGKKIFRDEIERETGRTMPDKDFELVWKILEDDFAGLFYQNGHQIICSIASIVNDNVSVDECLDISACIKKIAAKVERAFGASDRTEATPIARDISQAIVDLLHDSDSKAFEWMTGLCVNFVAICSLGLDPDAQGAVATKIKEMDLLLDTDIVISYLAEGEHNHGMIKKILEGWRSVGGKLMVPVPVLEEVTYHAHISYHDYKENQAHLHKYTDAQAVRYINNAFVRGYRACAIRNGLPFNFKSWNQYINNFHGKNENDYSLVEDDLKANGFSIVSDEIIDDELSKRIGDEIYNDKMKTKDSLPPTVKNIIDKSNRDGRLVATLIQMRKIGDHKRHVVVIISSSPVLAMTCKKQPELKGNSEPVMPVGALAFILSILPGTHYSLVSLKRLLFDSRLSDTVTPLQRRAMRIINNSTQYALAFSRRAALEREMKDQIRIMATERGFKKGELTEALSTQSGPEIDEMMVDLVYKSIDAIAYSKSEKENQKLKAELEAMKEENLKLRLRSKTNQ